MRELADDRDVEVLLTDGVADRVVRANAVGAGPLTRGDHRGGRQHGPVQVPRVTVEVEDGREGRGLVVIGGREPGRILESHAVDLEGSEIGRAPGRERMCQYG